MTRYDVEWNVFVQYVNRQFVNLRNYFNFHKFEHTRKFYEKSSLIRKCTCSIKHTNANDIKSWQIENVDTFFEKQISKRFDNKFRNIWTRALTFSIRSKSLIRSWMF